MTTPDDHGPAPPTELQFDHAEFATPVASAMTCKGCQQRIVETYYEVNGIILCDRCRAAVESQFRGGSGAARFLRACVFGLGAALAGTALYYLVAALTGYSFALIAIVVGVMVGSAVRAGSRHRGGWPYQALALFLTYTAIVSCYVPLHLVVLADFRERPQESGKDAALGEHARPAAEPGQAKPAAQTKEEGAQAEKTPRGAESSASPAEKPGAKPLKMSAGRDLFLRGLLFILLMQRAYAAPFLAGAQNIIGLLIIFFALQQAWRLNRGVKLAINGPFLVGDTGPAPQEVEGHE